MVAANGIELLIEVLDHQNPDIVAESVTLLAELTDEDIVASNSEATSTVFKILITNEVWNFLLRQFNLLCPNGKCDEEADP